MKSRMRITPGTVIATIALFVAVGGSAYAATKITTEDIANNAITARQVANDSLKGKDFKAGGLKGNDIADGKIGLDKLSDDAIAALKPRWLLLDEAGAIEEQSGGFTVLDAYSTNNNVYIDAGQDLTGHGLFATIALQNQLNLDGAAGADPSFNGQVSIGRCQTAAVECAPANSKVPNAFVVSPRQDDGSATTNGHARAGIRPDHPVTRMLRSRPVRTTTKGIHRMSRSKLPSPAMIVACLALIVAIGGSAYAASKINGKDIKKDSITGKQIKEKTVKNVASAKKAKTAKDANKVGGLKPKDLQDRWLLIGGTARSSSSRVDSRSSTATRRTTTCTSISARRPRATASRRPSRSSTRATSTPRPVSRTPTSRARSVSRGARRRWSSALRRTRRTTRRSSSALATATAPRHRRRPARRSTSPSPSNHEPRLACAA